MSKKKYFYGGDQLIKDLIANPPEECVEWPGSYSPDGVARMDSGRVRVPRRIMEIKSGKAFTRKVMVTTQCGKRGCCNPNHLAVVPVGEFVKKYSGGGHKKFSKGSQNPKAKLTLSDVEEIRALLASGERPINIARMYGVSRQTIGSIKKGRNWKNASSETAV